MKTINIIQTFFKHIGCREHAHTLHDLILESKEKEVTLDFQDIDFMSRSFMDEFYREVVTNPAFKVNIINMPEDFQLMLEAVSRTQHNNPSTNIDISQVKVETISF